MVSNIKSVCFIRVLLHAPEVPLILWRRSIVYLYWYIFDVSVHVQMPAQSHGDQPNVDGGSGSFSGST